MNFDGAKLFGHVAIVIAAGALLSVPALGCWPVVGAAVALYYLLMFFNALEQRDIDDATKPQSNYQRRKRLSWAALRGGPAFLLFSYADFKRADRFGAIEVASADVSEAAKKDWPSRAICSLDSVVRYRVYDACGGKHHADVDDWPSGSAGGDWG